MFRFNDGTEIVKRVVKRETKSDEEDDDGDEEKEDIDGYDDDDSVEEKEGTKDRYRTNFKLVSYENLSIVFV